MAWAKTDYGMPLAPHTCVGCGMNPMDDDGHYKPAIWAEGVDIDWGNTLYICADCADIISDLNGRATRGAFDEMEHKLDVTQTELAKALERLEEQEALLEKIREGGKAQKKIREGAAA